MCAAVLTEPFGGKNAGARSYERVVACSNERVAACARAHAVCRAAHRRCRDAAALAVALAGGGSRRAAERMRDCRGGGRGGGDFLAAEGCCYEGGLSDSLGASTPRAAAAAARIHRHTPLRLAHLYDCALRQLICRASFLLSWSKPPPHQPYVVRSPPPPLPLQIPTCRFPA